MYKIIIIDDEKNIREGLKVIFDWNKYDCEVIATLEDGKEGLEAALALQPDIIVTDIKMPIMDGLEMIKQLIQHNCRSKLIILSGYSEFQYAKKAIALGVKSYLLKPIDEEELDTCLSLIIDEINKEKQVKQSFVEFKERIETFRDLALKDIVDGCTQNDEEIKTILDALGCSFQSNDYVSAIIEISDRSLCYSRRDILSLEQQLTDHQSPVYLFSYGEHQIGCIICNNPRRTDYYYKFHDTISHFFMKQVIFAVGNTYKNLGQLSQSFNEARFALGYKLIKGSHCVLIHEKITEETQTTNSYSQEIFEQLDHYIDRLDFESATKLIKDYFRNLKTTEKVSLLDLQLNCLYFIIPTIRSLPSIQDKLTELLGKNFLSLDEIFRFNTLDELVNWLTNMIASIIELKRQHRPYQQGEVIDDIKAYIDKHYSENITLSSIADVFFISPYYLSQLFKSKTGQNYLKYLTHKRVEAGKELLQNSNLKIYEVASQVGYDNTKYFSKIFEKHVGCKPSVFRLKFCNKGNASFN